MDIWLEFSIQVQLSTTSSEKIAFSVEHFYNNLLAVNER